MNSPILPSVASDLTTSERPTLLPLSTAAWIRRQPVRAMRRLVEGGNYQRRQHARKRGFEWVWNVATNPQGRRRDLRFWSVEILTPRKSRRRTAEEVIQSLLPPQRHRLTNGEVCDLFGWQYENLNAHKKAGSLPPGRTIPRRVVERFLKKRLLH